MTIAVSNFVFEPIWRAGSLARAVWLVSANGRFDLLLYLHVLFSALLEFGKITFNYLCCFL